MKRYYSKELYEEMDDFVSLIDLERFSRFLRKMVFQYVRQQQHANRNASEFLSLLTDIEIFFMFLDMAEDEQAAKVAAANKR